MMTRHGAGALLIAGLTFLCSCVAKVDYTLYRSRVPRSILVLPPLNESTVVEASYTYLSTVTRPLAEDGYYVFPVAVIDAFMKDNGLPHPDEMHGVPLNKIKEVIGPDAVLYVTIEEWGQKYQVIASKTIVRARARLVDATTGATLWTGKAEAVRDSGGSGPVERMVAAVIHQIIYSSIDQTPQVSRLANNNMVFNSANGLLRGPRHPEFNSDQRGR